MSIITIQRAASRARLYAAGLGLLAACSAQASLIGDSVAGNLSANPDIWGAVTQQFSSPVTVGAGLEFSGQWKFAPEGVTSEVWDITVDIGATSLTVTAHENTGGTNNIYAYTSKLFGIALSGLDIGSDITGLQLVSGLSTIGVNNVFTASTSAHGIVIDWFNLPFGSGDSAPNGGSWTWEIQTGNGTGGHNVPEPTTAALVLAGLLGTVAMRRRRTA